MVTDLGRFLRRDVGVIGTSNVKAGHVFGIPIAGTHAHAFVNSFHSLDDLDEETRKSPDRRRSNHSGCSWSSASAQSVPAKVNTHEFVQACISAREELCDAIGFQVSRRGGHLDMGSKNGSSG